MRVEICEKQEDSDEGNSLALCGGGSCSDRIVYIEVEFEPNPEL